MVTVLPRYVWITSKTTGKAHAYRVLVEHHDGTLTVRNEKSGFTRRNLRPDEYRTPQQQTDLMFQGE